MTGRQLFNILDKIKFLFIPISWTGVFWTRYITPLCSNMSIISRYYFYLKCFKRIGNNVSIHNNVTIKNRNRIEIGNNVSIHTLCYLDGFGGLTIGNNVSIAHNTSIISFNHTWDRPDIPIKYNPLSSAPIIIEDDVWIGAGVRIMAGVKIKTRCIIAAGSVVTKDCESNSIYAGVPARKIKSIDSGNHEG